MLHLIIDSLRLRKIEELGKLEMNNDGEDNLAVLSKITHENHQELLKSHLATVYDDVAFPAAGSSPLSFNFFNHDFAFQVPSL